ncbi:MAG: ATP synthase F1 subunit epsilon [Deltaproteobacteria bacterium]|nr:ATP synthase F1 subunit epsilon [Deltaproteobacteria bacterium]
MANTFLLEIVTPYKKFLSTEVNTAAAPAFEGEIGILAGHTQYITILKPGEISYKKGAETRLIAAGKGYAEVGHTKTIIIVEAAEEAVDIDLAGAKETLAKCEEALITLSPEDPAYQPTVDEYELAQARIRVKEKFKG